MVLSGAIKCELCGKAYRIRVGVGFDKYQKHYFDCLNCNANIVFAIRASAPNANFETVENCERISNYDNTEVVNFHPNCAFDKDDLHNPFHFASLSLSKLISPHMRYIKERRVQSVSNQFDIPNAPNKWNLIKGIICFSEKDDKKTARFASQYMNQRNKDMNPEVEGVLAEDFEIILYEDDVIYPKQYIIYEFFGQLFYPKINDIVDPIIKAIKKMDKSVFSDLVDYLDGDIREQNQHRYLNTLSDYFRFRDHFGQIVFYSRINHDVDDLIVSSKGFDQIKLYYGDAFEALTSNMTMIACINNIMDGRAFDEFKSMTFSTYMGISKAKKANPFKSNPLFTAFHEDDIESSIRNGSHHASIWYDGEKVMYRSGGVGKQEDIPYSRYLDLCNRITIKLAALLIIEEYLRAHVKESLCFGLS